MCISELWDKNQAVIGNTWYQSPRRGENRVEKKKLFEEIMTKNLLKLMKTINLQIQETQQTQAGLIPRKAH